MFRTATAIVLAIGLHGSALLQGAEAQVITTGRPGDTVGEKLTSHFTVLVPTETAQLLVQDEAIEATSGPSREVDTQPLEASRTYEYTFVAEWSSNNFTVMSRTRKVRFRAGENVVVDLATEAPTDRARIRYVATPDEVVATIIDLAQVRSDDVVFEPGCGDARITIAAVEAGARRGVGVEIDAARIADAQARVAAASLEDKVEIRLGDALDIQDLSDATVVFLYMGEEFDMLIQPLLWRDLKVGTRIVSHRFTMGDWTPDETVDLIINDGFHYLIHLWTITPEIKARANGQTP